MTFPAQKFEQISGTPLRLQQGSWFSPSSKQENISHVQDAQIIKSVTLTFLIATGSQNVSTQLIVGDKNENENEIFV